MQPFFLSYKGPIIPFTNVTSITRSSVQNAIPKYHIATICGRIAENFTFDNIIDHDEQIKNYKDYLINELNLRNSNANYIH